MNEVDMSFLFVALRGALGAVAAVFWGYYVARSRQQ